MCDLEDLIDVESLDFTDDQTWLCTVPHDSGQKVDILDWSLSLDWPVYGDDEYKKTEQDIYTMLDEILKNQVLAMPDKHKFDSRTYVKPKKSGLRPSLHNIVDTSKSSPFSNTPPGQNRYLTYNKYTAPLGPILRLKTFNVEANTDNSNAVKEYAMKRKSLALDDDPQLENVDVTLASDTSDRLSSEYQPSKPINIDLSQPAHNIYSTFNKGVMLNDRGSLNMYQSGESLMRMSPPSLVSSLLMENSGTFNPESLDGRKSGNRDSGVHASGRESLDPMMTSMTLSILDEKDMSTSFLSQTTYPDHDSLIDSLPPSLVNSVNSSYIVSNTTPRARTDSLESGNIFSSATFTHLEQSEKLLSSRPRHQMYNSFKKENSIRSSGSYTKSREEASQIPIDNGKVLNENIDKKDTSKPLCMTETVTLHFSNNKFKRNAEKENMNSSFEKDDAFYKNMGVAKPVDYARNSLNVTLDKQELNEIIQARQKLSLARKALPTEPETLPNQVEVSPTKYTPNETTVVPKKSMENASELLSRRRAFANGYEAHKKEENIREPPKRNATFKKAPRPNSMDTTVIYMNEEKNIIDINSATLNLIDADKTLKHEDWGSQERAMVGSSESTDTGTFSSSSPPESAPDSGIASEPHCQVASTPLTVRKSDARKDMLDIHNTISPIYGAGAGGGGVGGAGAGVDKSYTVVRAQGGYSEDNFNTTINSGTMVVKRQPKRDILAGTERKVPSTTSYSVMPPPAAVAAVAARKSSLPTSKLRQYSSHRDLRLPVASNGGNAFGYGGRTMVRRGVYSSNPALSPTAPPAPTTSAPPAPHTAPAPQASKLQRTDSYTIATAPPTQNNREIARPVLTNPPALVRQGTETLKRDKPPGQSAQPKESRISAVPTGVPVPTRQPYRPQTSMRPYPSAVPSQTRVVRPTSVPCKSISAPPAPEVRPASSGVSALIRPSRLPAPRRTLRPPSVYSVAPAGEDNY